MNASGLAGLAPLHQVSKGMDCRRERPTLGDGDKNQMGPERKD